VVSLKTLADLLVEVNGGGVCTMRSYLPNRKRIDIGDYYADFSRIRAALGWEPCVGLRDGLARTLNYYRQHLEKYL
jgi:UDP-glucose 4-epimerase